MTHDDGSDSATPGRSGRDEMDGEHHVQLSLLYALREAVSARQDEKVRDVLERLADYSKMHFASEQLLMRLYQYGEYERHALDHERMMQRFDDLRCEPAAALSASVAAVLDEIDAGLVDHIRGADRALGHYLAGLPRHARRRA